MTQMEEEATVPVVNLWVNLLAPMLLGPLPQAHALILDHAGGHETQIVDHDVGHSAMIGSLQSLSISPHSH